jgi:SAM-dependent methyltransferase
MTTVLSPASSLHVRRQAMWASGAFAAIGMRLRIVGELLCEAVDLRAGERVLDVAAGNGNATLAAARRFARVTSTDYVAALLERSRHRAATDGLDVRFEVADPEELPYPDASFDVVFSTFGVMFTPAHGQAARELLRVCRPGGRIGLASWTAGDFLGRLATMLAKYIPPASDVSPRAVCGTEAHIATLFAGAAAITHTRRYFAFRYRSPEHWVDVFRRHCGPVHRAFAALDADGQAALEADLLALVRDADRGDAGGLVVPAEYVETVITR